MTRDSAIAPTLTSAKQCVRPRLAPVSLRSSTANTRAHNSAADSANSFGRARILWGAHASRVLVSASRRNKLYFEFRHMKNEEAKNKVRERGTRSPAREPRALPRTRLSVSRKDTPTTPGRVQPLPASPDDRHLRHRAVRQTLWNPTRTSARCQLLVV